MGNKFIHKIKNKMDAHSLLWSGIYSFFIFIVVYIFAYPSWESSDDFLISGILSGMSGESSPYVLVISYPLSYILQCMETWIPELNWLTMLELFSVWVSFAVFIWIFFNKKSGYGRVIAILLPIILETIFYTTLQYTRSACLLCFTGLFLVYYCHAEISSKFGMIVGSFLFILGSLVRFSCCLLVIPYVGIWIVIYYYTQIKKKNLNIHKERFFFATVFMTFVIVFSLNQYHKYMYRQFEQENEYVKYNSARAKAYDYLPDNYEEYMEEFQRINISHNDFKIFKGSMINDSFFDIEMLDKIADINFIENNTFEQKIEAVSLRFWTELTLYSTGRNRGCVNISVLFFIAALISLLFGGKTSLFPFLCTFIGTFAVAAYFIWTARFPSWVQDSLYLIGSISLLYGVDWERTWFKISQKEYASIITKRSSWIVYLGIVIGALAIGLTEFSERIKDREPQEQLCFALDHMRKNEQNIYVIDNFTYCPFPIMDAYGTLHGVEKGCWNNVIRVGSWFVGHPTLNHQLQKLEMLSPIDELTEEHVFLFTDLNSKNFEYYQIYYQEHYNVDIYPVLDVSFGNYGIYHFEIL